MDNMEERLRENYSTQDTRDLLDLRRRGLTDIAYKVMDEVLTERGVPLPNIETNSQTLPTQEITQTNMKKKLISNDTKALLTLFLGGGISVGVAYVIENIFNASGVAIIFFLVCSGIIAISVWRFLIKDMLGKS